MKKIFISTALVLSILTGLVGCSSEPTTSDKDKTQNKVEADSKDKGEALKDSEADKDKKEEKTEEVKEQILLDNDIVKIVLKGISNESIFGPGLKVELENKTDKGITVQLNETSVDGVMTEPTFSCDLAVGKKARDEITFMSEDVGELKNIEGIFHVFDSESWDTVGDYPFTTLTTESTSASNNEIKGTVLLDNEFITISYVGQSNDSVFGPGLKLEIVNKMDKTLTVQTRDVSVDGFMVEPMFSADIAGGKKAIDSITFMKEDVTELKNIEGKFHIFNSDSWDDVGDYEFNIQ